MKLNKIVYHGQRQCKATGWQRWGSFAIATLDSDETKCFPEGKDFQDNIISELTKSGVDCSDFLKATKVAGYPPKPEGETEYQHNYGYEVPEWLGEWKWSTTFGRWSRLVRFADKWEGFSYPKGF